MLIIKWKSWTGINCSWVGDIQIKLWQIKIYFQQIQLCKSIFLIGDFCYVGQTRNYVFLYETFLSQSNIKFRKSVFFCFRNDSVVFARVFRLRSYISEKRIYQKFISKIIFTWINFIACFLLIEKVDIRGLLNRSKKKKNGFEQRFKRKWRTKETKWRKSRCIVSCVSNITRKCGCWKFKIEWVCRNFDELLKEPGKK